jgi:hypothetical protein
MPCFLDSFLAEWDSSGPGYYERLCSKLLRFLGNHRLVASAVNEPYVENRIRVGETRRQVLRELEAAFDERANSSDCLMCVNEKCYRAVGVCCSRDKMSR